MNWFAQYRLMIKWQALNLKVILPFIMVIQIMVGVGTVIGYSFLLPDIDSITGKYFATGASTLSLITLGLVFVPQGVSEMKQKQTFEYIWALPISRFAFVAADFTIWLAVVLPSVVLTLFVASWRYDFGLEISPLIVPAFLLTALTGVALGTSLAHLSPSQVLTGVVTNVLIFSLFLFSPIYFPNDRLPWVVEKIHQGLPIKYMGDLVRGTVTTGINDDLGLAFAVVEGGACYRWSFCTGWLRGGVDRVWVSDVGGNSLRELTLC
jgi:ABC-2 type transport system permease protein